MSYISYAYFVLFLGSTFLLYTIIPKKYKWTVLLAASYLFYFINSQKYMLFLLATTASVYISGLLLNKIQDGYLLKKKILPKADFKKCKLTAKRNKKIIVTLMILFNFGLLVFLKYFNFLGGIFGSVLNFFHVSFTFTELSLVLPLGISFYTLQAASYIIDVYRGKYAASRNIGKVALFLSFFPQIVEGPIGRFDLMSETLFKGYKFNYENFTFGLQLIFWGLFKKIVIADRANAFVNSIFTNYQDYSGTFIIVSVLLYTLQLYAEFSGIMDIVTGSAQLFGVNLSKNFERPFFSKSVNEFWRRWHMTLGAWFRDYIFYSISLSKSFMTFNKWSKKHLKQFFGAFISSGTALFVVWFGTGIWHGASWKYIAYGLYYFVIVMLGMLFEPAFKKLFSVTHIHRDGKILNIIKIIRTFILVNVGMLLFRADSFLIAISMFKSMFVNVTLTPVLNDSLFSLGVDKHDFLILAIGVVVMFVISFCQERGHSIRKELSKKNILLRWAVYFALIFGIIIFGAYGSAYSPGEFIYAQF